MIPASDVTTKLIDLKFSLHSTLKRVKQKFRYVTFALTGETLVRTFNLFRLSPTMEQNRAAIYPPKGGH